MQKKAASKTAENAEQMDAVSEFIKNSEVDLAVEKRLVALYTLQSVDTQIDKIKIIRGELPQAIEDLEDEIAGLETRLNTFSETITESQKSITQNKEAITQHNAMIEKYTKQQDNVRNNREYESINKEIEFQNLEIQLCERKNRDAAAKISEIKERIEVSKKTLASRQEDLKQKKDELDGIIAETEKDEERLLVKEKEQEQYIDERYLTAYKRIRGAARNGLAVVPIDRDACGGCFSKIPPQRQMEIKMHKKVIVCEHCGRILVDDDIAEKAETLLAK